MVESPECNRKDKILDAAEKAFANLGFEGASLRSIVLEADVNLATVYYYFGSKEGLMEAVFGRRFGPMKQEQLDRLRQMEAESGGQPLPVETILEALLIPSLRMTADNSGTNQIAMRLIGRIVTEPNPSAQQMLRCQHQEVRVAFDAAFQKTLPHLSPVEFQWRLQFVWGALAFILANPARVGAHTHGLCDPTDTATVMPQMLAFFAAGLRAPAAGSPTNLNLPVNPVPEV